MRTKTTYEYHGKEYTMAGLTRISHLHRDTIYHRLNMGWTVEEALGPPGDKICSLLRCDDIGKQIPIIFRHAAPVFEHMQPTLGKVYIATVHGAKKHNRLCKVFFTVTLENGKQLITYPGEFEVADNTI